MLTIDHKQRTWTIRDRQLTGTCVEVRWMILLRTKDYCTRNYSLLQVLRNSTSPGSVKLTLKTLFRISGNSLYSAEREQRLRIERRQIETGS